MCNGADSCMGVTHYGCVINQHIAKMNHFFSWMEVANNYYACRMSNTFVWKKTTYVDYINIHAYQSIAIDSQELSTQDEWLHV